MRKIFLKVGRDDVIMCIMNMMIITAKRQAAQGIYIPNGKK